MTLTDEQIETFRDEHKRIAVVDYQGYEIVMRRPKPGEWERFMASAVDEKRRVKGLEDLTRLMIVYPDKATVEAIREDYPAFFAAMGGRAMELAGMVDAETRK